MSESGQRFYDEGEAEKILQRAAVSMPMPGAMSRERLMQTAAELGISPEAVERAERDIARERDEQALRVRYQRNLRKEFFEHLATYLAVNLGSFFFFHKASWIGWMAVFWGFGVVGEFWKTFFTGSDEYERRFQRWRRKQERRAQAVGDADLDQILDDAYEEFPDGKLERIRYVREHTGLGLKEAKEAVEQYDTLIQEG